jgi:hypothetical protein
MPLQLTFGHVVECIGDHVCLLNDLPNGAALTQEIVAGSVLPITKILAIEDHKLNITFLHVAFRLQSLLKPTGDQTGSDTKRRTREGDQRGGEWEPIKILMQELAYVPSSTTKPKPYNKVMNTSTTSIEMIPSKL